MVFFINCLIDLDCEPDEFTCDGARCIPKSKQCDRAYDCDDQTDERDCHDFSTTQESIHSESQKSFFIS